MEKEQSLQDQRVLVIGDTHGRPVWKEIVNLVEWDTCIFMGDYFDPYIIDHTKGQYKNFEEILGFKEESEKNSKKVVLLIGNHDYHYIERSPSERASRYSVITAFKVGTTLKNLYDGKSLQFAYQLDDVVFTHAGISNYWFNHNAQDTKGKTVAEKINNVPLSGFRFTDAGWDVYGAAEDNSPIWLRPLTLHSTALEGIRQVVGHTKFSHITFNPDNRLCFVDTLGESKEFLVIDHGKFVVHNELTEKDQ